MKKAITMMMLLLGFIVLAKAQNDTVFYVNDMDSCVYVCTNKYDRALIYADENCNDFLWLISGEEHYENPIVITQDMGYYGGSSYNVYFYYAGCDHSYSRSVDFTSTNVPTPATLQVWKRQYEATTLEAPSGFYTYLWNTGAATSTIEVTAPGTYTCDISDLCATATRTFIVLDNVELYRATCDLETNLNLVTWPTTPAQAEYVSEVEVKRDGLVVGTAPYTDGHFLDNIGSGSASRTYTVTAIATDGTPCPIVSYPKETIHMAYLTGINNTIEVNWNVPTGYDLLGYNICEWNPDGDLSVIDYVGATVTSYTCQESQFDNGYIVVQGVEAGKDGETRLLSNRSYDLVGLGEQHTQAFKVYPNPTSGVFTVEGTGTLTVMNTLGQTVLTREITGKESVGLPRGMWFVKLGETTRKIVVD